MEAAVSLGLMLGLVPGLRPGLRPVRELAASAAKGDMPAAEGEVGALAALLAPADGPARAALAAVGLPYGRGEVVVVVVEDCAAGKLKDSAEGSGGATARPAGLSGWWVEAGPGAGELLRLAGRLAPRDRDELPGECGPAGQSKCMVSLPDQMSAISASSIIAPQQGVFQHKVQYYSTPWSR
jgi:hypothetical protein